MANASAQAGEPFETRVAKRLVVSKLREQAERLGVVLELVEWQMPIGRWSWLSVRVASVSRQRAVLAARAAGLGARPGRRGRASRDGRVDRRAAAGSARRQRDLPAASRRPRVPAAA